MRISDWSSDVCSSDLPDGEDDSVPGDCARCHGRDGAGRGTDAFPKLAGLDEAYLLASLQAFASGERRSGIMQPIAADLDAGELRAMAGHYENGRAACRERVGQNV